MLWLTVFLTITFVTLSLGDFLLRVGGESPDEEGDADEDCSCAKVAVLAVVGLTASEDAGDV